MNDWRRIPKKQRIEVDWLDACSSSRWELLSETNTRLLCNRSLGYCLKKNRDVIVMAGSITEMGQSGDRITIPRSCVKAIRKVTVE